MKQTTNYQFNKPELTDSPPDITVFNPNFDVIDAELKERDTRVGPLTSLLTRIKTSIVNSLNGLQADIDEHKADNASINTQVGIHGVRYYGNKLDVLVNSEWVSLVNVFDLTSWNDIQTIVRQGRANEFFNVGDQFMSLYNGGNIIWEVIGINVDTPTDKKYTYSMTIQTKDLVHDIQFDAPEPSNPDNDRKTKGNNRYIHSAIRQWLNSSDTVFAWASKHQYDIKPTGTLYSGAGFLNRLDPELVAVLGAVDKRVARNTVTDAGEQDLFSDRVFLLSRLEVGLGTEGTTTNEFVYPYYNGIDNSIRVKAKGAGVIQSSQRLRSPEISHTAWTCMVGSTGAHSIGNANDSWAIAPVCCVV